MELIDEKKRLHGASSTVKVFDEKMSLIKLEPNLAESKRVEKEKRKYKAALPMIDGIDSGWSDM